MSSAVCPQCGSLRTRAVRGNPIQQIVALVRRQAVIACGRCGWKGRQFRLQERPDSNSHAAGQRSGEDRLDYRALDRAMTPADEAPVRSGGQQS